MPMAFLRRTLTGEQKTMPRVTPLPRFMPRTPGPNETQRYNTEHYNVATDYVYGLENRDQATPALTIDEYIALLNGFRVLAQTFVKTERQLLPTYDELAELVEMMDEPQFEEEGL